MKILHVTDLHFNKRWFEWILKEEKRFDAICITGDFLEPRKEEPLALQIEWVIDKLQKFRKPLFACSGNHDIEATGREDWLKETESLFSDTRQVCLNGIKFGCIPYIDPVFTDFDECDIVLYHLPPANTKTALHTIENSDWGDQTLYKALKNKEIHPKLLLCGHVHKPFATIDTLYDTSIFNPGADIRNTIPNHHIIEV